MDTLFAVNDRHIAKEKAHFAGKEGAFTAKDRSIVRVADHIAVKSGECERARGYFAVIAVNHAVIRGRNTA
jgi:hypothetical protein